MAITSGEAITITFGDVSENGTRMERIGKPRENGFSVRELEEILVRLNEKTDIAEIYYLTEFIPDEVWDNLTDQVQRDCDAAILVIRNGADLFGVNPDKLMESLRELEWDKKKFMYGRVVNSIARSNLCFSTFSQEPDYENKKGRIYKYNDVPDLKIIWEGIGNKLGDKAKNLEGEGNYYYDVSECGIGFHGDKERIIVVALRLGESMPIHYQWYQNSKKIGNRIDIDLHHGDIYIMSEKAVGKDSSKRIIPTLRHAAGSKKYVK